MLLFVFKALRWVQPLSQELWRLSPLCFVKHSEVLERLAEHAPPPSVEDDRMRYVLI